jgi:hypothetical protein
MGGTLSACSGSASKKASSHNGVMSDQREPKAGPTSLRGANSVRNYPRELCPFDRKWRPACTRPLATSNPDYPRKLNPFEE